MRRLALVGVALCLWLSCASAAGGPTPLDSYLDNLKTLRTSFQQTLVDAHGRELDRSIGDLVVVRPGKLRWETHPAGTEPGSGQLMIADGRNLWFYDRDLQQVIVKPADSALSATPAMLLSGTVDVRGSFTISSAGTRDGLQWVQVEPHGAEADFRRALFGFDKGDLRQMILDDKLGQTATIQFQKIERNGAVDPKEVSFTPPPGVDVIGTPRP
jgi:outer membrane lipoprotein carrier protein